jgi:predicted MFS family arabinose efflux permease
MFIVLYLSVLAIGLTQMKVPPIMGMLPEVFGVNMTSIAWLSNIFYVMGIALGLPGALILNKVGPKRMGIMILAFLSAGGILGVITDSFPVMLISRLIEGVGFSFGTMLGIVLINQWFEPKTANIAVGIFSTFPAAGAMIMLNFGAMWAAARGWKILWYICIIYSLVMLVLYALVIKAPESPPAPSGAPTAPKVSMPAGLKNGRALILGICFGCGIFVMMAFSNLYVSIFAGFYELPIEQASFYAGLTGSIGIVVSIICGILVSRTGKPALIMLISFFLLGITCFFTFRLGSNAAYLLHVIGITVFTGLIIPSILCLAPLTAKRPEHIGAAMAVVNEIYFIGALLSSPVVTAVAEGSGWPAATVPLMVVCVLGLVTTIVYMAASKSRAAELSA